MLNNGELPACSQVYSTYFPENATTIENQNVNAESKLSS